MNQDAPSRSVADVLADPGTGLPADRLRLGLIALQAPQLPAAERRRVETALAALDTPHAAAAEYLRRVLRQQQQQHTRVVSSTHKCGPPRPPFAAGPLTRAGPVAAGRRGAQLFGQVSEFFTSSLSKGIKKLAPEPVVRAVVFDVLVGVSLLSRVRPPRLTAGPLADAARDAHCRRAAGRRQGQRADRRLPVL